MDKIILDHSQLLGFDVAGNLSAKVGDKPAVKTGHEIRLDHDKLLGFDVAGNLEAKVGNKPTEAASAKG